MKQNEFVERRHPVRVKSRRAKPVAVASAIILFALVLAMIAFHLAIWVPWQRQQTAIREVNQLGARLDLEEGGPEWMRRIVGDEWMQGHDSVVVVLSNRSIDDDDLRALSRWVDLERLVLEHCHVTDAALKYLSEVGKLKELSLEYTRFNERGLQHLKRKWPNCKIVRM